MKKLAFFCIFGTACICMFTAIAQTPETPVKNNRELAKLFPSNVATILENSCFQCHTGASRNADAKKELNFSEWDKYSVIKKVGKLKEICETTSKEEMPPQKFLNKFPQKKLSDEQVSVLCNWVKTESQNLVKGLH